MEESNSNIVEMENFGLNETTDELDLVHSTEMIIHLDEVDLDHSTGMGNFNFTPLQQGTFSSSGFICNLVEIRGDLLVTGKIINKDIDIKMKEKICKLEETIEDLNSKISDIHAKFELMNYYCETYFKDKN